MALTCRNVQHLHDAYLDADIPASMIAEVDAHLLQCPECQRQIDMVRVCGNVISRDQSEPRVAEDFATRVLSALPRREIPAPAPLILTRRQRRRVVLERVAAGFIPAMAAMIALSILIFPAGNNRPSGTDRQAGKVLGESASREPVSPALALGVQGFVTPTLSSIDSASRAVDDLQGFAGLTLRDAREQLAASPAPAPASDDDALSGAFLMQMLHPLLNVVSPVPAETAPAQSDDVVRF